VRSDDYSEVLIIIVTPTPSFLLLLLLLLLLPPQLLQSPLGLSQPPSVLRHLLRHTTTSAQHASARPTQTEMHAWALPPVGGDVVVAATIHAAQHAAVRWWWWART
jgi:hypothetical protein